jgi:hypothetical protein
MSTLTPDFVPLPGAITVDPCVRSAPKTSPTLEEIAAEAYLIWIETGGNDVVNWLEAEARLRRGREVRCV